jgi:nicotinate-nucleotide pyrophosphorylase
MTVEILYFSDCPNHVAAVDRVREVLQQEGAHAELVEVEVKDAPAAQRAGFLGSPTIRVDGQDVEPTARAARAFGVMCRIYADGGQRTRVPPADWIRAAVREAKERRS